MGLHELKGIERPMEVFHLLGKTDVLTRLEISKSKGLSSFVGRDEEVNLLLEKWANGFENYTLEENNVTITVTVDLDTNEDFLDYMNETFPKALDKLKEICEK